MTIEERLGHAITMADVPIVIQSSPCAPGMSATVGTSTTTVPTYSPVTVTGGTAVANWPSIVEPTVSIPLATARRLQTFLGITRELLEWLHADAYEIWVSNEEDPDAEDEDIVALALDGLHLLDE